MTLFVNKLRNLYVPCMFLVGPRHIAPTVLDTMTSFVGVGSACTCAYPPKGIRQCFEASGKKPVMMVWGDICISTPPFGQKNLATSPKKRQLES
jgi:hypothetical protein